MSEILSVEDLGVFFSLDQGTLKAVDGVNYTLEAGKTIGIIGESGSGKSVSAQAIMRIVPKPGKITKGRILLIQTQQEMMNLYKMTSLPLPGKDLTIDLASINPHGDLIRAIRGKVISMIFQEPMTSLSPVHTVGNQIMEAIILHRPSEKKQAREITLDMLDRVQISNPSQTIDEYPYQLSGGMRQRAMIAMALSCNPSLLIADEPTTALDVTVQAQIIDLIKELQQQYGMAIQYITHDLGVIAEITENVAVMYLGRIVESGTTKQVLKTPLHPYTKGLLNSMPRLGNMKKKKLKAIPGNVPIPINFPKKCGFNDRCSEAIKGKCEKNIPALVEIEKGHKTRCFLHSNEME